MASFRNGVFADVPKSRCGHKGLGWALNSATRVFIRGERDGDKERRSLMKTKAERLQELPEAGGWGGGLPGASRG